MSKTAHADIISELKRFSNGAHEIGSLKAKAVNISELSSCALKLLKVLPVARKAVLEYYGYVFDLSIGKHFDAQNEIRPDRENMQISAEDIAITKLYEVLDIILKDNSRYWAPMISDWSLKLLGQLSSKYSAQMGNFPHAVGLNESLHFWMNCHATRTLIDLTSQCISSQIYDDTDSCIKTLLDSSVSHSPHFDWVVAHIGGCFPSLTISRVLSYGLKEFCHDPSNMERKNSKLSSIVGILGHLASAHSHIIHQSLVDIFQEIPNNPAIVPFLLMIASKSSVLLEALTLNVKDHLNIDVVNHLLNQVQLWIPRYFSDKQVLLSLVVHLILRCHDSGYQIIELLLDLATNNSANIKQPEKLQFACSLVIEYLLLELQYSIQSSSKPALLVTPNQPTAAEIPLLVSLQDNLSLLFPLLSSSSYQGLWMVRVLGVLAQHKGSAVLSAVYCHLLQNTSEVGILLELVKSLENTYPHILGEAIRESLFVTQQEGCVNNLLNNLITIVTWELAGSHKQLQTKIYLGIQNHLSLLVRLLGQTFSCHKCMELLVVLPLPSRLPVQMVLSLCQAVLQYFFHSLTEGSVTDRLQGANLAQKYLSLLCQFPSAQNMCLRTLLEAITHDDHAHLFGSHVKKSNPSQGVSLFEQNLKFGVSIIMPQRHSTIFHAGVIGQGAKPPFKPNYLPEHDLQLNTQLLLNAVQGCCVTPGLKDESGNSPPAQIPSVAGMSQLAMLLVEFISSDVMYNGLPWPEEDFVKVTVERDLAIKRKLTNYPILWELLYLVGTCHPALCYCSAVLRGVAATLMAFWNSTQALKASHCKVQLEDTCKLLNLMSIGQLLPKPLSDVPLILHLLTPLEVHGILSDIWAYMKENVPSPILFTKDPSGLMFRDFKSLPPCDRKFTERLRIIMLNNISILGDMYPLFFTIE